jgi:hypothetical protein
MLGLVRRLSADEIAPNVVGWPDELIVEVRECGGCGRSLAWVSDRELASLNLQACRRAL